MASASALALALAGLGVGVGVGEGLDETAWMEGMDGMDWVD